MKRKFRDETVLEILVKASNEISRHKHHLNNRKVKGNERLYIQDVIRVIENIQEDVREFRGLVNKRRHW